MTVLLFDGTFEGFLNVLYATSKEKASFCIESQTNHQQKLLYRYKVIETDYDVADKMEAYCKENMGDQAYTTLYKAFCSEDPTLYHAYYHFYKAALKHGSQVCYMFAHPLLSKVLDAQKKVSRESHLLLGLLRFKQVNPDLFYAVCEPTNHVLPFLPPHFAQRMHSVHWIIHDKKRHLCAVYNTKEWLVTHMPSQNSIHIKDCSADYEKLWQTYFKHIAIPERKNYKCQINHMPKKYWKHLIEKPE